MPRPLDDRMVYAIEIKDLNIEVNIGGENERQEPIFRHTLVCNLYLVGETGEMLKRVTEVRTRETTDKITNEQIVAQMTAQLPALIIQWRTQYTGA